MMRGGIRKRGLPPLLGASRDADGRFLPNGTAAWSLEGSLVQFFELDDQWVHIFPGFPFCNRLFEADQQFRPAWRISKTASCKSAAVDCFPSAFYSRSPCLCLL